MPRKPKEPSLHHLYLRGGTWWTKVDGVRVATGLPKSEKATAKLIRDQRLSEAAKRRAGIRVEEPLPCHTLAELIAAYLEAQSKPYDRALGGKQPGTKRTSEMDRFSRDRMLKHLDGKMLAADVTNEDLVALAEAIEREPDAPSDQTRRKHLSFLRSVYSWAEQRPKVSGIRRSPFHDLTKDQRREYFPKAKSRAYIFKPDQLRGLYALAKWRLPFVKFGVHTAMRFAEITTLRWACVNLTDRVAVVEARYAKNGRERDVPLGHVALGILGALKPEKPDPDALVFTSPSGSPIVSIGTWWNAAVLKVWKPSKPSERRPRFHDLRKTAATRVESVSSHAVAKMLLGHADEDVTGSYVRPEVDDVIAALGRAARLIDGEQVGNVLPFEAGKGTEKGTVIAAEQS